jgi:hypothetical protein
MNKQKVIVVAIICGFIGFSALSMIGSVGTQEVVRFALNCVLCFFLYKGLNWARVTMGVLALLAAGVAIFYVVQRGMSAPLLLIPMGAFYGAAAGALLFGKDLRGYFRPSNT